MTTVARLARGALIVAAGCAAWASALCGVLGGCSDGAIDLLPAVASSAIASPPPAPSCTPAPPPKPAAPGPPGPKAPNAMAAPDAACEAAPCPGPPPPCDSVSVTDASLVEDAPVTP
jgi:hypothetical protein